MKSRRSILLAAALLGSMLPVAAIAQQVITLADVAEGLPTIRADEPLATEFSALKAAEYLDRSALNWVVARELGLAADDPRLQRGIAWLKAHQRESGKWFTRSPVRDCGNLISNAGTAFAVLALQACGELPGWPFSKKEQP